MTSVPTDVLIVGAGLAGASIAHRAAHDGHQVLLVDRLQHYPDVFRAEKIEPDQAEIFRSLGLLDLRRPQADRIGAILEFDGQRVSVVDTGEQYGIRYAETVNSLRSHLPANARSSIAKVMTIQADASRPSVVLDDGSVLSARLVVLATGGVGSLLESLGIQRGRSYSLKSLSVGFDIEPVGAQQFRFSPRRGFNYMLPQSAEYVDYVTIFQIGEAMRVNVFTQWDTRDSRVRAFMNDAVRGSDQYFPGITEHIGEFKVVSKVQAVPTEFYRLQHVNVPGVVVVGDEFQSVSPATGSGLSKVATDVDVLCTECLPAWLGSGTGAPNVMQFYAHPRKVEADLQSFERWKFYYYKCRGTKPGILDRAELKIRRHFNAV